MNDPSPQQMLRTIEEFVSASGEPVLSEPGQELIPLTPNNFALEIRNRTLVLQAWSERSNLVRRITAILEQSRGRLALKVERFGKRQGTLELLDARRSSSHTVERRSARRGFREIFRRCLRREFPGFCIDELTTEPDLEHSLSPSYPRALIRLGSTAWAAIGASSEGSPVDGVLTFGLIWLDYLRTRETSFTVRGLVLFLPNGAEKNTCLRLLFLNPGLAHYAVFVYADEGYTNRVDLQDYGNLDTRLEPCRRRVPSSLDGAIDYLAALPDVDAVEKPDGSVGLGVHGVEFARAAGDQLCYGLETKHTGGASNVGEIESLARGMGRLRSPYASDRANPLYLRNREAWLESRVRKGIEELDATLLPEPIYGQVPAFAAADRGVIDLLATDRAGRLAILELKAGEDVHLPLQALDYWMRVKWHLDRGEFTSNGYFPGLRLRTDVPRVLLVAPALGFHPSTDKILRFFSRDVEVECVGVSVEWQKHWKVMFRK